MNTRKPINSAQFNEIMHVTGLGHPSFSLNREYLETLLKNASTEGRLKRILRMVRRDCYGAAGTPHNYIAQLEKRRAKWEDLSLFMENLVERQLFLRAVAELE